jgi:hypothetical protein
MGMIWTNGVFCCGTDTIKNVASGHYAGSFNHSAEHHGIRMQNKKANSKVVQTLP